MSDLGVILIVAVVLALRWPKAAERVYANISKRITRRRVTVGVSLFVIFNMFLGYGLVARVAYAYEAANECKFISDSDKTGDRSQHMNGYNVCISNAIMAITTASEPFPNITDSLERRMLIERLLRFQDPNKVGWMYLISQNGTVYNQFVVHGKPSSTQSSLTPAWQASDNDGQSTNVKILVPSPADDGSFGPNEGGDQGLSFFTAEGCLVETAPGWVYSDCQQNISDSYIVGFVDMDPNTDGVQAVPSSNIGCLDGTNPDACKGKTGG